LLNGTKVYFVKQLQVKDGDGEDAETRLVPMLREYTVFNVHQCDGLPDSIRAGKPMRVRNPDTRDVLADDFLRSTGADIREGHGEAIFIQSGESTARCVAATIVALQIGDVTPAGTQFTVSLLAFWRHACAKTGGAALCGPICE